MNNIQTNPKTGLTKEQVQKLQKQFGPNALPRKAPESIIFVFLRQFINPLIYILVLAAALIFALGHRMDAFIITGVLLFNALLGTIQEGRTRSILLSLQTYFTQETATVRDSVTDIVPSEELVPGDIIIIHAGEKVPADATLIEADNILIDEAVITGESTPVAKEENDNLSSGTYILTGHGKAIIIATGPNTKLGKLNIIVETIQTDTPLKQSIDQLAQRILIAIFIMCVCLFIVGLLMGKPLRELLVIITALFICVIPEGLPVVFTLTLVSGAYRMAKKNVITKRMQAIEGLGRTNILMIDKTGTLTRNEMIVTSLYAHDKFYNVTGQGYKTEGNLLFDNKKITLAESDPTLERLIIAGGLLNQAEIEYQPETDTFHIKGDPTEAAIDVLAKKTGLVTAQNEYQTIVHMPFSTELRYQAGLYKHNDTYYLFVTGAPEVIFALANNNTKNAQSALDIMLEKGLRTVAAAQRKIDTTEFNETTVQPKDLPSLLHDLTILGLFGIQDTIRSDVKDMIENARAAGLRIVMATGDHQDTALYVARSVGIFQEGDTAVDGSELKNGENLENVLATTTVFSRVTPEQKLHIAQAFQQQGNRVAMTGDGVNDAPALVAADLGIAMGGIGTEVAKEAADLILLDDSFASIIEAIKEGRTIFLALRRVILYFFTTNLAEVWLILFSFIVNLPLPILAAQILWINLVTDGFLDAALSQEPQEHDILQSRHTVSDSLLDATSWFKIALMSIPMGIVSIGIFAYYAPINLTLARTLAMTTLATCQWFNAWNCRSEHHSLLEMSPFSNLWLIAATVLVLILQLAILYIPILQKVFNTVSLTIEQWLLVLMLASPVFLIEEIRKYLVRHKTI
ncbi:MAG: cation-translocating P-type ATPase [Candidatus Babeliales bacterium]